MDDISFILLGLAAVIGLPAMVISAFVMVLNLKARVRSLEARVDALASGVSARPKAADPDPSPGTIAPARPAEAGPRLESEPPAAGGTPDAEPEPEVEPEFVPDLAAAALAPAPRKESLEEKLGARWAVWVGGLALGLGGIFLVRYSIEAGLIGPGARVLFGLAFSLGLVAAGEVLRRRQPALSAEAARRGVYIPGVVTAAGTTALFATVYAAHALYGFIGAGTAFVALGLVGVATIFAAGLHGPWLAALGLVGAYATPFLVSSREPNPWALVIYLLVVTAAAFALARLRLWRWLAIAASIAALAWGAVIIVLLDAERLATAVYVLALAGLVLAMLVVEPYRRRPPAERFDRLALATLAAVGALAILFAWALGMAPLGLAVALIVGAGLLAVALAFDAVAPAAGIAALVALGVLLAWPIAAEIAGEPVLVVPGELAMQQLMPAALMLYYPVALLAGLALLATTTTALMRRSAIAVPPAAALALAGTFGPLAMLACAYLRSTGLTESVPFGAFALAGAALLSYTGDRFLRREGEIGGPGHGAAGSIHIAGAAAALGLALTMLLAGSGLTLAFALAALGCAIIAAKRPLAALRWSAAAFAVLVLLRSGGAWTILGDGLTTFPGWADIALRHALPALALFLGGVFLRRRAVDTPAAMLDGAAIVLGTVAAALAIRLLVRGPGDAMAADIGPGEAGLYVALAFGMAIGLARGALTTTSPVHRRLAPVAAIGAAALAFAGPILVLNPAVSGEDVAGGPVVNSLLLAYALPALLAGLAAWLWDRIARDPAWPNGRLARPIARIVAATALVLAFFYVTLETRVLVSGPDMSFSDIPTAESYAYSAVWLGFGIVLLALGLVFRSKGARLGSALVIMLAVAKVFLVDMSDLEGAWRALSFIGLGAVLIGIGLVYQRLLFGKGGESPPPQTA